MAIKTAAEMFGDGTAGNPQVPIDLNAPPGFNALSRGTAFGEQVTSAIKNRTPYSLALNDEDLNTRLADFEVRGLDGAYDLGTLGPAGGGRTIIKDAGAITTASLLGVPLADDIANAHWRADMRGDSIAGGVGFDAVGGLAKPNAGFMDRAPIDISDDTIIAGAGAACTLASGGANRITLGAGRWKLGAATNLALTFDVVEVSGGLAGENGLYVLSTFVDDTTATFVRLDGTAASFTAGAATVHLHRRKFASAQVGNGTMLGSIFHGEPGDTAALMLLAGKHDVSDPSGATNALLTGYRDANGTVYISSTIDAFGRFYHELSSSFLEAEEDLEWGLYGHKVNREGSSHGFEAGFIFQQAAVTDAHGYALTSLIAMDDTAGFGLVPDPCDFDNTGVANRIDCVGAAGTDFQRVIANGTTFCEIISGPAGQPGYYYVDTKVGHNTLVVALNKLDGTAASFPGPAGSPDGTIRFFSAVAIGKRILDSLSTPAGNFTVSADWRGAMTIQAPYDNEDDSNGILITLPDVGDVEGIRVYAAGLAGAQDTDKLVFAQNASGDLYNRRHIYVGAGGGAPYSGDFLYQQTGGRARSIFLPAFAGMQGRNQTLSTLPWTTTAFGTSPTEGYRLRSDLDFPRIFFPLNQYLPHGSTVTGISALVKPGAIRLTGDAMQLSYFRGNKADITDNVAPTYAGPLEDAEAAGIEEDDLTTTDWQQIEITGLTEFVNNINNNDDVNILVAHLRGGDDAGTNRDDVFGLRIDFLDLGPSNI